MHNPIKKLLPIGILVLSSLLLAACNSAGSSGGPDDVVAKVGTKDIKLVEVDRLIKQQLDQSPGTVFTPAELANARLSVITQLIQEEALFQKAQKENLVPDDQKVKDELQKQKNEQGVTEDQYQQALKQAGLTEDEAKEKLRRQLAIVALQDKVKTRVASPSDDEVKKYYDDRPNQWIAQPGVDFSMIVVDPRNNGIVEDAIGDAPAEAKANAIYAQLKSGTVDFATLASQRSEEASAVRGGKVGFMTVDQLKQSFPTRPEIPTRMMAMTPGQYTEPLKDNTSGAYYIFKLDARRDRAENLTLDAVRQTIVDNLTQQRQQVLYNAVVVMAMSEANPKNYLAERFVEDPKRIVDMKPSALLQQASQQPQQPPAPRVENQNPSTPAATNSNAAAPANTNSAGAPRPAAANTNK